MRAPAPTQMRSPTPRPPPRHYVRPQEERRSQHGRTHEHHHQQEVADVDREAGEPRGTEERQDEEGRQAQRGPNGKGHDADPEAHPSYPSQVHALLAQAREARRKERGAEEVPTRTKPTTGR